MMSVSHAPSSFRPRLTSHSRFILALRDTPIVWASSLRYPAPALSLLARLPSSPSFLARIAPHSTTSSAAVVTYQTHLQLAHSFLIIRSPTCSTPAEPIIGLLPLVAAGISQVCPGVLAFAGILLEPHPRDFAAIAAALSRAVARPASPLLSRFEVQKTLAVGSRAKVYTVRDRSNGERLALKLLRRPEEAVQVNSWLTRLVHERAILHRVRGHPFIVDLRHAVLLPDICALFFEMCPHNLFDVIRLRGSPLTEQEAAALIAQLVLAMFRVHAVGGAVTAGPGRGLRPENVLFDGHGWVRLASFGYCSVLDQGLLDEAHLFRKQSIASKRRRRRSKSSGIEAEQTGEHKSPSNIKTSEDVPERVQHVGNSGDTNRKSAKDVEGETETSSHNAQQDEANPIKTSQKEKAQQTTHGNGAARPRPLVQEKVRAHGANTSISADLWSLGALAHYALTGEFPLQEPLVVDRGSSTSSSDDDELKQRRLHGLHMSPKIQSDTARDFVAGLLHGDPAARLGCGTEGIVSLQKHAWLAHIVWQDLERRQGPYALSIEKQKEVNLLDLGEQGTRDTFSSSVLPEGLAQRETRLRRLSKLLSRDSRERRESVEGITPLSQQDEDEVNNALDVKTGNLENYNDEGFVFGFGFSSTVPAFVSGLWPRVKPAVVNRETENLESERRRRWSGSPKGKRAATAVDDVR